MASSISVSKTAIWSICFSDIVLPTLVWQVVGCAFNLTRLHDGIEDLIGDWANSFSKDQKALVVMEGDTICWTLWKTNKAC